jgi:hypothetical protein
MSYPFCIAQVAVNKNMNALICRYTVHWEMAPAGLQGCLAIWEHLCMSYPFCIAQVFLKML